MIYKKENRLSLDNDLLNEVCIKEGLNSLDESWNKIDFSEGEKMLKSMIIHDLAYINTRVVDEIIAQDISYKLIQSIGKSNIKCYTNWFLNPWESKISEGWNSVTTNTIDMALAFLNNDELLFVWKVGED